MMSLAVCKNGQETACRANLWYNRGIKNMFALAVLEHPRADDKKGTLVMSSSIPRPKKPASDRFFSFVVKQENGCWLWTGCKTRGGYGSFRNEKGKTENAHRWAYRVFIGSVPEGLELDHLCRNRSCVNPHHLEPVTRYENTIRGMKGILRPHKASKYVGVYWTERLHKWNSHVKINGKNYHLGHFSSEEDAHQVYMEALINFEQYGILPSKKPSGRPLQQRKGDRDA